MQVQYTAIATEVRTITPEVAEKLLETNVANRPVKVGHVATIANDMKNGLWQFNGDAIRIAATGELLDGQHRLMACVLAKSSFRTLVVSGLPPETKQTIDGGVKRSFGDRLGITGVPYATNVAATARLLAELSGIPAFRGNTYVSAQEMHLILSKHPEIVDSVKRCHGIYPKWTTRLSALHYIATYSGHSARAEAMVEVWKTGLPDYDGCPMHALRERVMRDKKLTLRKTYPMMATAWEAFRGRRPLTTIRPMATLKFHGWGETDLGIPPRS